ncbi:PIN-like domain-containing protein [Pseudomonas putida]|uniref:PIN-like domain-containing protein n=1 Tax=Pseudomonas putida TaxID=303 RepID=UPI0027C23F7A|nr:PIN-like domain-containing protein [Pseudomonas putida]MDQ2488354.1 PIN-like domain-containing protein [Pseudomonas putida]
MAENFVKRSKYPQPAETFKFELASKERVFEDCLYVLDANVLLLPYTADAKSLAGIRAVYERLVADGRLWVPAQAAREYLDVRATKLADVHEQLFKKQNQNFQFSDKHPLLEEVEAYAKVLEIEGELKTVLSSYRKALANTLDVVKGWAWDDPVSKMYQTVLADSILDDDYIDEQEMNKELARRNSLKLPPGYKDGGKDENQIGDLLIWNELLNLARGKSRNVVFVSGDEKGDWWHQSSKKNLYPRFELVDEFRRLTDGQSFHIISLSELLKIFDAQAEVVEAVEVSERMATEPERGKDLERVCHFALGLVNEFRNALENHRMQVDALHLTRWAAEVGSSDLAAFHDFGKKHDEYTRQLMNLYERHKVDFMLCREQMLAVYPELLKPGTDHYYQYPTNPLGVTAVADDLERLAKSALNKLML